MALHFGVTQQQAQAAEPRHIKKFRRRLIQAIPRVPNDRASLQHMEQKHFTDLLADYLNWRSRYVGVRPRSVSIEPAAQGDPRWAALTPAIDTFLESVRSGADLTPHLSLMPHTRGYAVAARAPGATPQDRWSDKDLLLNTMGYHHFHLSSTKENRGQSDDLIFAEVGRGTFKIIAIFGHDVFDQNSAERKRLWAVHQDVAFRDMPPGSFVVMGGVSTSAHTTQVARFARHCARLIRANEPKLDDLEFVKGLYLPRSEAPAQPKPEWRFLHLDLAIYDAAKPGFLIIAQGWN